MGWLNPIMIALSEGIIVLGPLLAVLVYLCIETVKKNSLPQRVM